MPVAERTRKLERRGCLRARSTSHMTVDTDRAAVCAISEQGGLMWSWGQAECKQRSPGEELKGSHPHTVLEDTSWLKAMVGSLLGRGKTSAGAQEHTQTKNHQKKKKNHYKEENATPGAHVYVFSRRQCVKVYMSRRGMDWKDHKPFLEPSSASAGSRKHPIMKKRKCGGQGGAPHIMQAR